MRVEAVFKKRVRPSKFAARKRLESETESIMSPPRPGTYNDESPATGFHSMPSELVFSVACHLGLADYSRLGRTCRFMHAHFDRNLLLFLKNVYGLSVCSGSLVMHAYAANLQYRAQPLLERILDEFFKDTVETPYNIVPSPITEALMRPLTRKRLEDRWPTYLSVLYSLDRQPNVDPPQLQELAPCHNGSPYPQRCALNPKLDFLKKYVDRLNAKFAACAAGARLAGTTKSPVGEWNLEDVREKKIYHMIITQNIYSRDVTMLRFYFKNYGVPVNLSQREQLSQDAEMQSLLTDNIISTELSSKLSCA